MTNDRKRRLPRVFMMDLWATVPYYTAYLSRALLHQGLPVQVGSITYYLDRSCFQERGLRLKPGCSDLVGRLTLSRAVRRPAKLLEGVLNLSALVMRFAVSPPEIVHVQFLPLLRSRLPLDLWFVRFCKHRGAKLVLTVHDLLPHDTGNEHKAVYQHLYREMDALICHSEVIRGRLRAEFDVPDSKIRVIPHGPFFYDLPVASPAMPEPDRGADQVGEQTVLWQGIIFPYKGVDLLLEAWQKVEAQSRTLRLRILGTGEPALLVALQRQAGALGLKRVTFDFRFCSVEELVAAYKQAAIVVYPYRAITTSGALATGLALKKVIVASNLQVFRELLHDGENALLVDPASPVELAGALMRLATDPALTSRLQTAVASMHFGDQSWSRIAQDTMALYQSLLQ